MESSEQEENKQQSHARKPFQKPHLRVYGHISVITQGKGVGNIMESQPTKAGMRTAG
jgi:hypothetical protein